MVLASGLNAVAKVVKVAVHVYRYMHLCEINVRCYSQEHTVNQEIFVLNNFRGCHKLRKFKTQNYYCKFTVGKFSVVRV